MSDEPLSAEGVDEYERHGLYGRWVGTIRDRERQVGQAWEALEKSVDETQFFVEAFEALYEDMEAERERIKDREQRIAELDSAARGFQFGIVRRDRRIAELEGVESIARRVVSLGDLDDRFAAIEELKALFPEVRVRKAPQPEEGEDDD